ncbi:SCO family protein [Rhodohalobacter sp. 8-1]|uniref:SCO family protein n=1 Tax=Rhodohalobacter sp. 8-1 TaxID=3131972 RepID=UPI0030EF4BB8
MDFIRKRTSVTTLLIVFAIGLAGILLSGCDRLAVKKSMADENYELVDQNGTSIQFPKAYLGNVMLVGYVYTHCPDICPMITYNMRDIQQELSEEENFMLISISFDPTRDSPEILHQYADNYKLDQQNWRLLTGNTDEVDSALETLEINTLKSPTSFDDDGTATYYIDHTDRVTLIDRKGNVRNTYVGSKMNQDEIISDIHKLLIE